MSAFNASAPHKSLARTLTLALTALLLVLNLGACGNSGPSGTDNTQSQAQTPAQAAPQGMLLLQPPIKFTCEGNVRFAIAFARNQAVAALQLTGQTGSQTLANSRIASGIEYANANYVFREHQGATTLTTIQGDKTMTIGCHKG